MAGTAIKITSVFNIDTPSTAVVTIDNPSTLPVINGATMVKEDNGVYSYVAQTLSTWVEGDYVVTISITYAGYTSVAQEKFTLIKQE